MLFSNGHFLDFKFSIESMNLNYGSIFSFPNKPKIDYTNICTNRLIMRQKIYNNFPSEILTSLEPLFRMLVFFVLLKYDQMLQIFK